MTSAEYGNPYNFVPAPPRGQRGGKMPEGLRDGAPAGHHRWHEHLLSGEVRVRMTTATPLLVLAPRAPDQVVRRNGEDPAHTHLEVATAEDAEGVSRVDLPVSSVRGMLRAAYEMVTNSRFGIFDHTEPLGYRSRVEDAKDLAPALVHPGGEVEFLGKVRWNGRAVRAVATVPAWDKSGTRRRWLLDSAANRQVVRAAVEFDPGRRGWLVTRLWVGSDPINLGKATGDQFHVRGILHVSGPNIKNKSHERLFITDVGRGLTLDESVWAPDPGPLCDGLRRLIAEQHSAHRHSGRDEIDSRDGQRPWEYKGHEPGRTAWSRHLYQAPDKGAASWLGPDTVVPPNEGQPPLPCWVEQTRSRLRPVMVSRLPHDRTPQDLLDPSLWPATAIDDLSPADRVFGWVAPRTSVDSATAHRAQLRITELVCPTMEQATHDLPELTLPPLATPKPGQGRFYLGDRNQNGVPQPLGKDVRREDMFTDDRTLRGRKVYPHHGRLTDLDDETMVNRLRYTPPSTNGEARKERDGQNATLHSWVGKDQEFTFTCRFQDLTEAELGALLWLLDPDKLGRDGRPGHLRLGRGKPFGFGSVLVEAVEVTARTGAQIADQLRSLGARGATTDVSHLADKFEDAMSGLPEFATMLGWVRHAAVGFPKDRAIDYPRATENGPAYEWFVQNDKKAGKGGAASLPTLPDQLRRAR